MNVKSIVLGIGIFIVYLLMLGYGIEAFYPSPKYDAFCNFSEFSIRYPAKAPLGYEQPTANCSFSRTVQEQTEQCFAAEGTPLYSYDDQGCTISLKECNLCNKEYTDARIAHEKVLFVIALIVGVITLFVGYGVLSVEPVGSALMASGVGAIVYGSARNWENLSNIWRFLLLVVALVLLIWIALRVNKKNKNSSEEK